MSIRSDRWIREQARAGMIAPFVEGQIRRTEGGMPIISAGVSSYGYDMRVAREFKVGKRGVPGVLDPKFVRDELFDTIEVQDHAAVEIPANGFALCRSVEHFRIPRDILVVTLGKSSYARCGLIVNVTPLEPEWEGYVTIELSNTAPFPVLVYAGEGIAQCLFYACAPGDECEVSYRDKQGKYQNQAAAITHARV